LSIAEKVIGPMLLQWLNAFGDCEIVQKAEKKTGYLASYFQDSDEKDTNPDVIRVAGKMCKFEYVLTMRQGLEQHVKVGRLSITTRIAIYPFATRTRRFATKIHKQLL
jgi:hypothetical protein